MLEGESIDYIMYSNHMHPVIYEELFNTQYRINRPVLDFILDELDRYHLNVDNIIDYDHCIIIKFSSNGRLATAVIGEIRIDRIARLFIVSGYCDGYLLPSAGDWDNATEYLKSLVSIENVNTTNS